MTNLMRFEPCAMMPSLLVSAGWQTKPGPKCLGVGTEVFDPYATLRKARPDRWWPKPQLVCANCWESLPAIVQSGLNLRGEPNAPFRTEPYPAKRGRPRRAETSRRGSH